MHTLNNIPRIMLNRIAFSLFSLLILISCKKTYENGDPTLVINEVMPVNSSTVADQNGEFDDWIELYNLSTTGINMSGYYLSDSKKDVTKWKFPEGTTLGSHSYLIIWADNDTLEAGLHANFKLSSAGEDVVLSDSHGQQLDKMSFPAQELQLTWSRVPNGTGPFKWQSPTYNRSNDSR